ncbi:MAG: HAMP domain-containing histidine kinase [Actinobacteria bacterium]|nr:MAG: HAMP domain-containing histidine kinase [Actinomycetota bacterium]
MDRDHRHPGRGRGGARLGHDPRLGGTRRAHRRVARRGRASRGDLSSLRDRASRVGLADGARDVEGGPGRRRRKCGLGRHPRGRQKNFAASASHELRTPTTSILGFVEEVLENDALSEEDRGFLQIVYRNAQRLSQLIDDLLILGEAEIGASMMHLEPTALVPLVERVTTIFSAAAQRAGITLGADHDPDPPLALVDPLRFEQALTNLVSNALKFTPDGGDVKVAIRGGDETVDVSVADTGMGIHPTDVDSIFGRFYRTRIAVDTAIKGSGLGLAIAKRMIEAQSGTIRVTSRMGHGSTFTVTLPVAKREPDVV